MNRSELERMELAAMELDQAEAAGLDGDDLERARLGALARVGLDDQDLDLIGAKLEMEQLRRRLRSQEEGR